MKVNYSFQKAAREREKLAKKEAKKREKAESQRAGTEETVQDDVAPAAPAEPVAEKD